MVEPLYTEPLHNKVLGIFMNNFIYPSNSKLYGKNLDIMKPCYSEQILPVPWPFVISRFHCSSQIKSLDTSLCVSSADNKSRQNTAKMED